MCMLLSQAQILIQAASIAAATPSAPMRADRAFDSVGNHAARLNADELHRLTSFNAHRVQHPAFPHCRPWKLVTSGHVSPYL